MAGDPKNVIVVGGGLAGITATCELLELGCSVTLIDKNPRQTCGNSSKASSGILAPLKDQQLEAGISDSQADIKQLISSDPAAAAVIAKAGDVQWLLNTLQMNDCFSFKTTASTSAPRVYAHKNPHESGQTLCAMAATLFNVLSSTSKLTILRGSSVTSLLSEDLGGGRVRVYGVECVDESAKSSQITGSVVLCTGGSAGKARAFPAACDSGFDGSSLSLATSIGADTERLEDFSITPFACKYPGDEGSPTEEKFAISKCLCGPGVAIVNASNVLIADLVKASHQEINDAVTNGPGPVWLVIGQASKGVLGTIQWYVRQNFMQMYTTVKSCAAGCKVPEQVLDEAFAGIDKPEPPAPWSIYAIELTPAVYSCPGGLQVNADGSVKSSKKRLEGLYAAGEAAAGPGMSAYSVAGFPLLQCIVSGRAAAASAAKAALGGSLPARQDLETLCKEQAMKSLKGEESPSLVVDTQADDEKLAAMSKDDLVALVKELKAAGPPAAKEAAPAPAPAADAGPPEITLEEVSKHNKKEDAWLVINGDVIDVTNFIPKHPGGVEAICSMIGKDASSDWNAIHKPGTVERVGLKSGAKKIGKCGSAPAAATGPSEPPFWDLPACEEGEGKIPGIVGSFVYLLLNFANNLARTFLYTGNLRFKSERMGTIRSGLFLVFFIIAHSMDNQVTHLGRVQYNSMSYMMADGIQGAATVGFPWFDTYIIMAVMLHASVAIKRSWEINMDYTIGSGRWKWLISGLCILFFLVNHLMDFRFAQDIDPSSVKMVQLKMPNTPGSMPVPKLTPPFVFFCDTSDSAKTVMGRDIYGLAAEAFTRPLKVLQYVGFVVSMVAHLFWAWPKVCTSEGLAIPTGHQKRVANIGLVMAVICGCLYASIPLCFYIGIMPSATSETCGF